MTTLANKHLRVFYSTAFERAVATHRTADSAAHSLFFNGERQHKQQQLLIPAAPCANWRATRSQACKRAGRALAAFHNFQTTAAATKPSQKVFRRAPSSDKQLSTSAQAAHVVHTAHRAPRCFTPRGVVVAGDIF
ncbi:MAG: hypothetical protein ACR2LC_11885 [Pyrinomonadaceae bacterium]